MFRTERRSSMASLSPSTISEGVIYVALKCYFDGSETKGRFLTLGAVAGDEQAWVGLEFDWKSFLQSQGASYMHMKEAMVCAEEFKGWTDEKRDWVVSGLLTLLQDHQRKSGQRLRMFTTTVDLVAYDEISEKKRWLPSPARMCVRGIYSKIA